MDYLSTYLSGLLGMIFIIFVLTVVGYLIGCIRIKGLCLGTAGILLAALVYGIMLNHVPQIVIGGKEIVLYSDSVKSLYSLISSIGTALFVSSVALLAGPKFFRMFNRKSISYVLLSVAVIICGGLITCLLLCLDRNLDPAMAVGLMMGALTSTPGLSAAKEAVANADIVAAGYGIAYLFGVFGVVLFVQIMPRLLRVDMDQERRNFIAANAVSVPEPHKDLVPVEPTGLFAIALTVVVGCIIGALRLPGTTFSLGTSGGVLLAGLVVGHFGRVGRLSCQISKATLNCVRELGLVLFLIGAGVPSGVNFMSNVRLSYFLYGAAITLFPMVVGYILARRWFKLSLFNSLGAITGGMTSTPALGSLITVAGTDEVAAAYAAAYPIALVMVVLCGKLIPQMFA